MNRTAQPAAVDLSIIVPLYNEEEGLPEFLRRLLQVVNRLDGSTEILLIDDGSEDATWSLIVAATEDNPKIQGLSFSRNFGHQPALMAGLEHARGAAIITLDGDGQHPAELIPKMMQAWRDGYSVVQAVREDTAEIGLFKRWSSRGYYRVFSWLAGFELKPGSSDFRLIDRKVRNWILEANEADLLLRGAVRWTGAPTYEIPYRVEARIAGLSRFNLRKMLALSGRGIVSFSTVPLQLGIWIGLATSLMAFLEIGYILVQYTRGQTVPGWASVLTVTSFMFGILFVLLGILGVYVGSLHRSLRSNSGYMVLRSVGRSEASDTAFWRPQAIDSA